MNTLKLKLLLLIIIGFYGNFSIFAQSNYVYLQNKNFYINGHQFYPQGFDYAATFIKTSQGQFVLCPDAGYSSNNFLPLQASCNAAAATACITNDFNRMASKGVNCIRLIISGAFYDISGQMFFHYSDCASCPSRNSCNQLSQPLGYNYNPVTNPILFEFFTAINNVLNIAATYNIKVILVAGSGDYNILVSPGNGVYAQYLTALSKFVGGNSALMAYDLLNEPIGINIPNSITFTKNDVCTVTTLWYNAIKPNASQQLVTIGDIGSIDAGLWDPAVMDLDFVCFHPYGEVHNTNPNLHVTADPYNPAEVTPNINRVLSEIYWFGQNVSMPWMLGETGFAAKDANPVPFANDVDGSLSDQSNFVAQTMMGARAAGSAGYLYWQYGTVNWGDIYQDELGLQKQWDPPPTPQFKPAISNFSTFNPFTDNSTLAQPPNYYNAYGNNGNTYTGNVVDQNSQPIQGAVVTGFDNNYANGTVTFSQPNGNFNLVAGFIPHTSNLVILTLFGADATSYTTGSFGSSTNLSLNSFSDDSYNLSNLTFGSGRNIYDARNYITAGNNLIVSPNPGNLTLIAGKYIDLYNGFDAQQGSLFDAFYGFPVNCANVPPTSPSEGRYMSGGGNSGDTNSTNTSIFNFLLKEPVSITDSTISAYISPNPTFTGQVSVYVSNPNDFKEIRVIDMLGNTVTLIPNPLSKNNINLSNLPRGIYAVKISGDKNVFIRKIIFE